MFFSVVITQIDKMEGHRGPITGLAFRENSSELYSTSLDRTMKVWNADQMAYVSTLHGHVSEVMGVDSYQKERAVSCGVDRTVRLWRVRHLVVSLYFLSPSAPLW